MARKETDLPAFMTPDGGRGGYFVRNPITKQKKRFADEADARAAAEALGLWVANERKRDIIEQGRPTFGPLVDLWMRDELPFKPWGKSTRVNNVAKLRRIQRELKDRVIDKTDCLYFQDYLAGFCKNADAFNKWRYALAMLCAFAVSRKMASTNEAAKVLERSTSKKIDMNRKVRQPLDVPGFHAVHAKAEPWLQLAMELSMLTLQARREVCDMQHQHFRDGHLFVIRQKTAGDSDMAFIKIAMTTELESLRARALRLDNALSPYLIHRRAVRRKAVQGRTLPHWTYIRGDYLTKAFQEARDACGLYADMEPEQRPTFHEVRGLGSRIAKAHGVSKAEIQALMTHSNPRTTAIYLEGGLAALSDGDYVSVTAPLTLAQMLQK